MQAALLASIVTSCLAWPGPQTWPVRAFWLTALLLATMSLALAAQQAIALTRVWNSEHAALKIRLLLGVEIGAAGGSVAEERAGRAGEQGGLERRTADVEAAGEAGGGAVLGRERMDGKAEQGLRVSKWRPSRFQLYVWQLPSMLLGNAVLVFVIGLAIWVFSAARTAGWGDEGKIAVFFGVFLIFVLGNYGVNWWGILRVVQKGFDDV